MDFINYLKIVLTGKCEGLSLWRTLLFSFISIFLVNLLTKVLLSITSVAAREIFVAQLEFAPTIVTMIVAVFFMPIYEELVFRLFLEPTSTKILVSSSLLIGLTITYVVGNIYSLSPFLLIVVIPIALSPMISLLMIVPFRKSLSAYKRVSILSRLEGALNKDIKPAYYMSAILFSAMHIAFQKLFFTMSISIMMIMFMNYFLVGLILGNVRISKGIVYAIIVHFSLNLIVYLRVLF